MVKKVGKWFLLLFLAAGMTMNFAACGGDDDDGDKFSSQTTLVSTTDLGGSATTAKSSDEAVATVTVADGALTITSKQAGSATITAQADGYTDASVSVTVDAKGAITLGEIKKFAESGTPSGDDTQKTVSSIAIASEPTKKDTYVLNDVLDPAGLSLTVTYTDESTGTVAYSEENKDDFAFSGFDAARAGEKTVTVTYKEQTATFTVTVKDVSVKSIAIAGAATKTEYYVGDTIDVTGLTITITYSDDSTSATPEAVTAAMTTYDFSAEAEAATVTITKGGKTTSYTVTVKANPVATIAVTTAPTKTEYNEGDTLDTAGLVVTATLASGKTRVLTAEEYEVSPTTLTTAGDEVEITVKSKETPTATATFKVKVVAQTYDHTWSFLATDMPAYTKGIQFTKNVNATPTDVYYGAGLYIASSNVSKSYLRTDQDNKAYTSVKGLVQSGGAGGVLYIEGVKGPATITAKVANTGSNTGRTAYLVLNEKLEDLFASKDNGNKEFTSKVGTSGAPASASDIKTLTYSYEGTGTVYVGVAVDAALRVNEISITGAAADFSTADDATKGAASAKALWDGLKTRYAGKSADDYTAGWETLNEKLSATPTDTTSYCTAANAVILAELDLKLYVKPTSLAVTYGGTATEAGEDSKLTLTADALDIFNNDKGEMQLTATEKGTDAGGKEVAITTSSYEWTIADGSGGLQAAAFSDATSGLLTGITGAAGSATITVKDKDTRAGDLNTTGVSFTLNLTAEVKQLAAKTDGSAEGTYNTIAIKEATSGAVTTSVGAETTLTAEISGKTYNEAVTYAWYSGTKAENATEVTYGDTAISGATAAKYKYTFTAPDAAATQYYKVVAKGETSKVELTAEVVVTVSAETQWYGTLNLIKGDSLSAGVSDEIKTETKVTLSADGRKQDFVITPPSNSKLVSNSNGLENNNGDSADGKITFVTTGTATLTIKVRLPNNGGGVVITKPDNSTQSVTKKSDKTLNESAENASIDGSNIVTITFANAATGTWIVKYAATKKTQIQTITIAK